MVPSATYSGVLDDLSIRFAPSAQTLPVRLIGLAFCRPDCKLMRDDISPSLRYFHFRSGKNVAFYFAGYETDEDVFEAEYVTVKGNEPPFDRWFFSSQSFNSFRDEVEKKTKWHYSGECDLILTNAKFNQIDKEVYLDFSSSILIQLDRLFEIPSAPSVSKFFEQVFRYAETQDPNDPASGFSDWAGVGLVKNAFWQFIVSWLPNALQSSVQGAIQLATQDISV